MEFIQKTIEDIPTGSATCRKAVQYILERQNDACYQRRILDSEQMRVYGGNEASMNLSSIQTKLIQITGRFVEDYASDIICTLSDLDPFIRVQHIQEDRDWVIPIGLRKSGIDHDAFIISRLSQTVTSPMTGYVHEESVYRKILALYIHDQPADEHDQIACRTIMLLDISDTIRTIDEEDKKKPEKNPAAETNSQLAGDILRCMMKHAGA